MSKYRKKPVIIDAIQVTAADYNGKTFDGSPFRGTMPIWLEKAIVDEVVTISKKGGTDYARWEIHTLEGVMTVEPGDWIIKGVKGELYPCKPDIFEATYEKVTDDG